MFNYKHGDLVLVWTGQQKSQIGIVTTTQPIDNITYVNVQIEPNRTCCVESKDVRLLSSMSLFGGIALDRLINE
jgi:ribosomal protein L24